MRRSAYLPIAVLVVLSAGTSVSNAHTIRGHGPYGGHGTVVRGVYYSGYVYPYYYPLGFSYAPYYYPVYPVYYGYDPPYVPEAGYLDTDVAPEDAAVYLDGQYVGIADNFDGFPGYLPVEPGRHSVTFKAEGYRSVTRQVRAPRGAVLDLDFTMSKGEEAGASPPQDEEHIGDSAALPSFLRLRVSPADASVYLDGEFYATASQISSLHGDLRLEGGTHRIEVVKPGYKGFAKEVTVPPGERRVLAITLEPEAGD